MAFPAKLVLVIMWLMLALPLSASAQQFSDFYHRVSFNDISHSCFAALNSTLDCPYLLWQVSMQPQPLTLAQTELICTSSCIESLLDAQKAAKKACTTDADVIWNFAKTVATAVSWTMDELVAAFNMTCVKDLTSGDFCAFNVDRWPRFDDQNLSCSTCALDSMNLKLKMPLGYSDEEAGKFISTTSRCNATGYTIASPTRATLNVTHPDRNLISKYHAAPTPTWARDCDRYFKIGLHQTYNSIAAEYKLSAFALRADAHNPIADLDKELETGTSLCMPDRTCKTYTVKENETCSDIISKITPSFDRAHLEAWNPKIGEVCDDPARLNGSVICILPSVDWELKQSRLQHATATTKATSTFGCEKDWSRFWPGKPYNSCGCPFAPRSCYTTNSNVVSVPHSWWVSCYSGRATARTDGDCGAYTLGAVPAKTTPAEVKQTDTD